MASVRRMRDAQGSWHDIEELLANDGLGMLLLKRCWIGDEYEVERIGTNLSISREHVLELHRGGLCEETRVSPPPPPPPGGRRPPAGPAGVVPMRMRFDLSEVIELVVVSADSTWRSRP